MHVYIATKFSHKGQFTAMKDILQQNGHFVTHDWTQDDASKIPDAHKEKYLMKCGAECLRGIQKAEVFVLLAVPNMAGAFVELGVAIALQIPIVILNAKGEGNQDPVFYHLPQCSLFQHAPSIDTLISILGTPAGTSIEPTGQIVRLGEPNDFKPGNN